jgi:beta-glucosidase
LHPWLLRHGATPAALEWFLEHGIRDPALVGINLYPLFSRKVLRRSPAGLRVRMPYGSGALVARLGEAYCRRYRRPVMITETASAGSVARRAAWLADSLAAVHDLRGRGIPLVGYTWWPLFALVGWAYRQGRRPVEAYLVQMGLWDLAAGAGGLERIGTALVDRYRSLIAGGNAAVGPLRQEEASDVP